MASGSSSKMGLLLADKELNDIILNDNTIVATTPSDCPVTNPALTEIHRQESGIFEGSSDFSDASNCFSDNDMEWSSCDEDEGADDEDNAKLWESFQQCTYWSPFSAIKQYKRHCVQHDSTEEQIPMIKVSSSGPKKVTFKPDRELVTVHHIIAWEYAYRACRRGPWEKMAQDRARFARRIEELSVILEPCLQKKLVKQVPTG